MICHFCDEEMKSSRLYNLNGDLVCFNCAKTYGIEDDEDFYPIKARIYGVYEGKQFIYEDKENDYSLYIDNNWVTSEDWVCSYSWREGIQHCDCYRGRYVGIELECGNSIDINFIQSIDDKFNTICLFESMNIKFTDDIFDEVVIRGEYANS